MKYPLVLEAEILSAPLGIYRSVEGADFVVWKNHEGRQFTRIDDKSFQDYCLEEFQDSFLGIQCELAPSYSAEDSRVGFVLSAAIAKADQAHAKFGPHDSADFAVCRIMEEAGELAQAATAMSKGRDQNRRPRIEEEAIDVIAMVIRLIREYPDGRIPKPLDGMRRCEKKDCNWFPPPRQKLCTRHSGGA